MKKVILIIASLCLCNIFLLNAQINSGKVLMGVSSTLNLTGTSVDLMSLGYSSIKYKSDAAGFEESDPVKMTSLNFSPRVGFFVANNLALGLDINIALSSQKDGEDDYKSNQTSLGFGPFIRYYIPGGTVIPFLEAGVSIGEIKTKYESEFWDSENKTNIMSYLAGIGIAVPIGERVTFDLMAGYNSVTVKDKNDNDDNDRTVIGTFGLKLGFIVILGTNPTQNITR